MTYGEMMALYVGDLDEAPMEFINADFVIHTDRLTGDEENRLLNKLERCARDEKENYDTDLIIWYREEFDEDAGETDEFIPDRIIKVYGYVSEDAYDEVWNIVNKYDVDCTER